MSYFPPLRPVERVYARAFDKYLAARTHLEREAATKEKWIAFQSLAEPIFYMHRSLDAMEDGLTEAPIKRPGAAETAPATT